MVDIPNMHTKLVPEIVESDLKAVRQFLAAPPDRASGARSSRPAPLGGAGVPLRHGIARARSRSAAKPQP